MSSSVDLPTFEEVEKLLHTKLNAAMQAIAAKFLAGVSTADLDWPITAEGNLDMSIHEITNGRKIWGVVNAASYPSLDDAVAAASAGGVVFVPPNTTVSTSGETDFAGLSAIVGAGPSSVIKFSSGAATSLLTCGSATSNMVFSNLTLDGNAAAGTVIGVELQSATDTVFDRVVFKDFSSTHLSITSCTNVFLNLCRFSGGSVDQIKAVKAGILVLNNCTFDDATGVAVLVDASGLSDTNIVVLNDVVLSGCTSNAVKVLGWGAPGATSPVEVHGNNVVVTDSDGATAAVLLGGPTDALKYVTWRGGSLDGLTAGGMQVNASGGSISDVVVEDPATFGIDLDVSQYVGVHDCVLRGDGVSSTVGVDGSGVGVGCNVHDNSIEGFTTAVATSANLTHHHNVGSATEAWTDVVNGSGTSTASLMAITIPANLLQTGDMLVVDANWDEINALGSGENMKLRLNSQALFTVNFVGGGAQYSAHTIIVCTGSTTARVFTVGVGYDTYVDVTGLDWTAAQTLDLYATLDAGPGVTATARALVSQYVKATVS